MNSLLKLVEDTKQKFSETKTEKRYELLSEIQNIRDQIIKEEQKQFNCEIINFNKSYLGRLIQRFFKFNRLIWFWYKKPQNPGLICWCISSIISILRDLHLFSQNFGLEDESWEFYKLMMRHMQEQYRLKRLLENPFSWKKFKLWFQEIFSWIFDLLSEFGINVLRVVISSIIIIFIFGFIYARYDLIGRPPDPNEISLGKPILPVDTYDNYYYSFVVLLNLGAEVMFPASRMGMILQCFEAVLGWLLLGILITYLTKHLK